MQYAQPLSCEARIRTSSRSRGSMPTRSSSRVAALSRWDIARENAGRGAVEVEPDGDLVSIVVMAPPCAPDRPTGKVHFRAGIMGHFRGRPAPRPGRDARAGRAGAGAAGRRCGPGGCAPAPGCRRPGRWPPTCGSPATRSPRRTGSWSPRAGWSPGRARAPGWRTGSRRRRRRPAPAAGPARPPGTACARARPTSPRSRGRPGWRRPAGAGDGAGRRVRLRRPARPARAAPGAGRLPGPGPRRARRRRADRGLRRLHPGARAALRGGTGRRGAARWRPRPRCQPATGELVAAARAARCDRAGGRARRRAGDRRPTRCC